MEKLIKPVIPLWKVLCFSLGFFGVELFIAVFGITTPQFAGDFNDITGVYSYLWLSVPVVGIFVQPLVGFWGDHIWSTYGRRGFFILLASSFGAVSIFMIALSQNEITSIILFLIVLVCINTLIVSYRTVVCEMTPPAERLAGYAMLSVLQLLGILVAIFLKIGVTGDVITYDIKFGMLPNYLDALLIISAIVLLFTALFGSFFLKEYPNVGFRRFVSYIPFSSESEKDIIYQGKISYMRQGAMWLSVATIVFLIFSSLGFSYEVYVVPFTMAVFAILLMIAHKLNTSRNFLSKSEKHFTELMTDIMNMPFLMKKLNIVMLFGWFAIFLFMGNMPFIISEDTGLKFLHQYNAMGFDTVTSCYIFFIVVAIIVTAVLIFVKKQSLYKYILMGAIFMEALFMILFYYYHSALIFIFCLIFFGVLLAVIFTLPYAMLSMKLPSKRVGVFLGIFNVFIAVPYIIAPSISSSLASSMGGLHGEVLVLAFVSLCFSLVFSFLEDNSKID